MIIGIQLAPCPLSSLAHSASFSLGARKCSFSLENTEKCEQIATMHGPQLGDRIRQELFLKFQCFCPRMFFCLAAESEALLFKDLLKSSDSLRRLGSPADPGSAHKPHTK